MKVFFKHMVQGYIGRADDLIFYYNRRLGKVLVRRKPHRRITQSNLDLAAISKNLSRLYPSQAYKDDFRVYLDQYSMLRENENHPLPGWYNLYMKMMYAMAKADPTIDLKTLTRARIETENLPCITVKDAIQAGLLPQVLHYSRLDNPI